MSFANRIKRRPNKPAPVVDLTRQADLDAERVNWSGNVAGRHDELTYVTTHADERRERLERAGWTFPPLR